ncbi:MAG: 2-amino-4-hydroxy-6-hydroxymethyldihydropteridine diphosphokinase [Terriglobales bacterium]
MNGVVAFVALGSNLGEPKAQVLRAFDEIAAIASTKLVAKSPLYRSAPVGLLDQPAFVNACALVETLLAPRPLLDALLAIERTHGRVRDVPNGPRTLDLDIALYGEIAHHEHGITVPHPRVHERAFVLVPLVDVWPEAVIPGKGRASDWLARVGAQGIEKL